MSAEAPTPAVRPSTARIAGRVRRSRTFLPTKSLAALAVAVTALVAIGFLTWRSGQSRTASVRALERANETQRKITGVRLRLREAEAGQRSYIITGDPAYLGVYDLAAAELEPQLVALRQLTADQPEQRLLVDAIEPLARHRISLLVEGLELYEKGDRDGAFALVLEARGRPMMDQLARSLADLLAVEERRLAARTADWEESVRWSGYVMAGGGSLLLLSLVMIGWLASRDFRRLENEGWIRRLQLALGRATEGDLRLATIGEGVLAAVVPGLDAQVAALYASEADGSLVRIAGHALEPGEGRARVAEGEGLVGQAARGGGILHVRDVPPDYLTVSSALGQARPRELVVMPLRVDGELQGVLELGFLGPIDEQVSEALDRMSGAIGAALRTARDRDKLEVLLTETQRQAAELQAQQEELRVTNEELEQQGRVLQLSQTRLENQQAELEQINSQLEEQTQALERQRDELARTSTELTRANEYKSQFLANMSHELRTPLNSSLILAKLLAENREGNLTDEQITFASTIYSAGNDLLDLINDILDLSKIEAGMLEVRPETIPLARLADELRATFQPLADQRGLELAITLGPGAPDTIETDPLRLPQILKNLLSNAIKFTERGGVTLEVSATGGTVAFAVRDTGIGIAVDQHELIFEAFRQADGATNRKFGGTGLGLSISRDLARLLGGDIVLDSAPGRGSTFTLRLPREAATVATDPRPGSAPRLAPTRTDVPRTQASQVAHAPASSAGKRPATQPAPATPARAAAPRPQAGPPPFEDDRARITPGSRSLLVVEDDPAFARVLADLGHELDYLVAVATTGEDGLALASALGPSAILLDVSLPDRSGLAVLDLLKRDPRTRHVPVHVVSGHDYTRTALEMGAAGYAVKPVQRDQLVEALRTLEARFTRKLRRVLIVEDDPQLRDSTARLLATDAVETVTAGTTAEALEQLRSSTFDCVVLDLSLPDRSGLDLLADMAEGDNASFPPVIVYTGRQLTAEQVRHLERFSRSIIIKGARSPERLLDEVTLFLHQVESELPPERQRMLRDARSREAVFEGKRILVVEDDVRNVFALSAVLEPRGATVDIARNGKEALAALDANPEVDLVLMDIMMPEMDGIEATRALRADPRFARLPIIALTAKAMADDRDRCLAAGASDYIAKPLDVDRLLSLARVWIRK